MVIAVSQKPPTVFLAYLAPAMEDMAREVQAKNIKLVPHPDFSYYLVPD